jgi:hypothetical protein
MIHDDSDQPLLLALHIAIYLRVVRQSMATVVRELSKMISAPKK